MVLYCYLIDYFTVSGLYPVSRHARRAQKRVPLKWAQMSPKINATSSFETRVISAKTVDVEVPGSRFVLTVLENRSGRINDTDQSVL
jgi:hypothetical protein